MAQAQKNTKERLIDTAIDLIWESSYGSVSVDDICKAADVKKGSFYHFFPSKIDLAIAAMDETYSQFLPVLNEIFSPSKEPLQRILGYAKLVHDKQCEITEKHGRVCGCPMVSLATEMAPQDESIRKKTQELIMWKKKFYVTALRDMVAEGVLPEGTDVNLKADNVYAYIIGQMTLARIMDSLEPVSYEHLCDGLLSILGLEVAIQNVA